MGGVLENNQRESLFKLLQRRDRHFLYDNRDVSGICGRSVGISSQVCGALLSYQDVLRMKLS
jgi:hypothetical protein